MHSTTALRRAADTALDYRLGNGQRWYVAQTIANREFIAKLNLEAQGFTTFWPQIFKTVRHARKLRTIKTAVFPGYQFVALDVRRDRWRSVNGTRGVARLIMVEDAPSPVPCGVVESLIDSLDERGICRFDRDLIEGQAIRVTSGPFAEAVGRLVSLDARGRVRALLDIMGGQVLATLEGSALTAA
ncbi:MAG: transcription termination/antitermination protein NusG [Methylocystis sp.]